MSETKETTAAIVNLSSPEDGDVEWTAQQKDLDLKVDGPNTHCLTMDWSFGPLAIVDGYFDPLTFEVVVTPVVNQVYVGRISGNLKDGVTVRLDLSVSKGQFRLFLKNGNEVWIDLDIKILFNGHYSGQYKLFNF